MAKLLSGDIIPTLKSKVDAKQDKLTFDTTPTSGSNNPVTSGGVKSALDNKVDNSDLSAIDTSITNLGNSISSLQAGQVTNTSDISSLQTNLSEVNANISSLQTGKQDILTAGDNITIENNVISATVGGGSVDSAVIGPCVVSTTFPSGAAHRIMELTQSGKNIDIEDNKLYSISLFGSPIAGPFDLQYPDSTKTIYLQSPYTNRNSLRRTLPFLPAGSYILSTYSYPHIIGFEPGAYLYTLPSMASCRVFNYISATQIKELEVTFTTRLKQASADGFISILDEELGTPSLNTISRFDYGNAITPTYYSTKAGNNIPILRGAATNWLGTVCSRIKFTAIPGYAETWALSAETTYNGTASAAASNYYSKCTSILSADLSVLNLTFVKGNAAFLSPYWTIKANY